VLGEDSSDASAFLAYLDWANRTFEAEHWAVIVVGHGGKINEVSPDDHRTIHRTRTWMRIDQFASAVSNFNRSTSGRVELLFFQNCNKATLEVVYEARNCARYTLASQLTLGAPNYYYEGFLKRLQELSIDGREAAIAIMDSETLDMYHTLTRLTIKLLGVFQINSHAYFNRSSIVIWTQLANQYFSPITILVSSIVMYLFYLNISQRSVIRDKMNLLSLLIFSVHQLSRPIKQEENSMVVAPIIITIRRSYVV
jgi:hypothetical protein